ncbi:type 4 pilus major pilin [Pseudomonas sp. G(2018)]|uniref:type 4 pilus major pilin n=1 Tax=Pseudomonas sp. G(2018) TaxID=2502242 RepID=UPI0010F6B1D7|nr:type 4 pilus major pilin [Pseudomonas sp. G(2018)]
MTINPQQDINMEITNVNNMKKGLSRLGKSKQGGFGLPELAIVLMIAALIAAAAFVVVPRILASVRAGKIIDEFNTAIPAIQTAYQNQTSFNSLTTAQVAQNGWLSSSFVEFAGGVPTGNLLTQWGTLTFVPISSGSQGQGSMNNIPTKECVKIGTNFTNDLYLTATINGTAVKTGVNNVDLTAVGTQCSSTPNSTIIFTFGRA